MKTLMKTFLSLTLGTMLSNTWAYFGEQFCQREDFNCLKVKASDSWESLFPDPNQIDLVQRINRINIQLSPGMIIAVPKNIEQLTIYDIAPFPRFIPATGEKSIYVDQKKLAWGAYNPEGELVWWGPVSGGSGRCNPSQGDCLTPTGTFRIIRKNDETCISTVFPKRANGESGGALMPYCMHFWRGFALHGSEDVPGKAASHGCVRMFIQDARWLNEEFVDLPGAGGKIGTRVVITEK